MAAGAVDVVVVAVTGSLDDRNSISGKSTRLWSLEEMIVSGNGEVICTVCG